MKKNVLLSRKVWQWFRLRGRSYMGMWGALHAVLALAFVLGLLFVTLWFIKYVQMKTPQNKFFKKLQAAQRIEILETKKLDARNSLILIRKDNKEYLFLSGASGHLLLEAGTMIKETKEND